MWGEAADEDAAVAAAQAVDDVLAILFQERRRTGNLLRNVKRILIVKDQNLAVRTLCK